MFLMLQYVSILMAVFVWWLSDVLSFWEIKFYVFWRAL